MRRVRLASLLPQRALGALARRFDTPGAFECAVEGSSFWMDASYWKWCRRDKRRHRRHVPYEA
jgi:hypothetical protein